MIFIINSPFFIEFYNVICTDELEGIVSDDRKDDTQVVRLTILLSPSKVALPYLETTLVVVLTYKTDAASIVLPTTV